MGHGDSIMGVFSSLPYSTPSAWSIFYFLFFWVTVESSVQHLCLAVCTLS